MYGHPYLQKLAHLYTHTNKSFVLLFQDQFFFYGSTRSIFLVQLQSIKLISFKILTYLITEGILLNLIYKKWFIQ